MNYLIADFLIRIKNAYMAGKNEVVYPYSGIVRNIGKILKEEGYIKDIKEKDNEQRKSIKIELLYKNKKPVLREVIIVSKPSAHIYVNKNNVPSTRGGFGITILSTSHGVMSDKRAKKENIGGEVICQVY